MFVKTDVYFNNNGGIYGSNLGVQIKLPPCAQSGVSVTPQQIMSDNAGRNANTGTFYGDVKCLKYTITLSWDRLKESDFAVIDRCVNNCVSSHSVTMKLRPDEDYKARNYYLSAGSYTYAYAIQKGDVLYYEGVTLQLIER
jgi:hypothetical protein